MSDVTLSEISLHLSLIDTTENYNSKSECDPIYGQEVTKLNDSKAQMIVCSVG